MSPRVLVVEHQASCPPALVGEWLTDSGVELVVARPWAGEALPEPGGTPYSGLVVLGGQMSANDDDTVAWLPGVKQLIRTAVADRLPVLGVCLGHQLVAVALGGEVRKNPHGQTVGLTVLGWTHDAAVDPLTGALVGAAPDGPEEESAEHVSRGIHWNSDVVTRLPEGAVTLATTPDGFPQAVRFSETAWGVQLHPEADEHVVRSWAEGYRDDHLERGIDQEAVLAEIAGARAELDAAWRPLVERFARMVADAAERR